MKQHADISFAGKRCGQQSTEVSPQQEWCNSRAESNGFSPSPPPPCATQGTQAKRYATRRFGAAVGAAVQHPPTWQEV
eukprot:CAMPEP_0194759970 /NCGR_PEP_ID=MMETSP0323_2-20130528/12940_1 /TAXON_ID=2866 ORGANISM="Crypthecodinium cohnii, Strain Seligo" /NCGR_SAMPLE_ID=MMETSP0323_2 /ASSEMBLY_ACC=CAM_ASM_000346 /LENGTH=77 /DNA_ID=CAMNT_0039680975 /DNA_START=155 /DNA_END=388 /DNA_ORIENTATION=-